MIFLFFLILMIVPSLISILIILDNQYSDSSWFMRIDWRLIVVILANLSVESIIYYLSMQRIAIPRVWGSVLSQSVSYQDLYRWCRASAICIPFSIIIGNVCRHLDDLIGAPPTVSEIKAFLARKNKSGRKLRRRRKHIYSRVSSKTTKIIILITAVYIAFVISGGYVGLAGSRHLSIIEVCRKQLAVDDDDDCSYFILRNEGNLVYETEGLFLSTNEEYLKEYRLERDKIWPGENLKIEIPFIKSVEIKKEGGSTVFLSNQYEDLIDMVDIPELGPNYSYVLQGESWNIKELPDVRIDTSLVKAPEFSAEGGFFDSDFLLRLSADDNATVYYTLDGSNPTEESIRYTNPIEVYNRSSEPNSVRSIQNVQEDYLSKDKIGQEKVDKAFIVRAIAIDETGNSSAVVSNSYFIGLDQYKDHAVVSLISDPDSLFGKEGIYVTGEEYDEWYTRKLEADEKGIEFTEDAPACNFMQRGKAWERAANFELYNNEENVVNQLAGIRIAGSSSRSRVLKRFSLISRKEYSGSSVFESSLFGNKTTHSIRFRENFNDAFSHALVSDRDLATLSVRPVSVFLNGEYWYETYIQEKYGDRFFSETYGVAKDDIEFIEVGYFSNLPEEQRDVYDGILTLANDSDFSKDAEYYAFNEIVDIQSYIDYTCCQAYLGNADAHEKLNTAIWRTKIDEFSEWGDGRWRWALYDMDLNRHINKNANGHATDAEVNSFTETRSEEWPPLLKNGVLWEALKESPVFCKQYVLTFMDLVNTDFEVGRVASLLEQWGEDISYDDYFFRDRAGYITKYLAEEFDLKGSQESVSIHCEHADFGTIVLNTIEPDISSGTWSGKYFTDFPITLTAKPIKGHKFIGWKIDGEIIAENEIEMAIKEGGSDIYAIFE